MTIYGGRVPVDSEYQRGRQDAQAEFSHAALSAMFKRMSEPPRELPNKHQELAAEMNLLPGDTLVWDGQMFHVFRPNLLQAKEDNGQS
jgi:ectoine hydroxylase-related dioxygenase (phytanoyl-CoA dioxygenase family)